MREYGGHFRGFVCRPWSTLAPVCRRMLVRTITADRRRAVNEEETIDNEKLHCFGNAGQPNSVDCRTGLR